MSQIVRVFISQVHSPLLDPLTLDQLRILAVVADTGSFSAAARQLGRVQSAISQSMRTLETALGTAIFDRAGKIPTLNDAGRVILADARRLIEGAGALKARAESINSDIEPELTLAVDAIFPVEVLAGSLKDLARQFPDLPVTLYTEGLSDAEQRLRDGTARLALYVPFGDVADNRDMEYLVRIPTVAVVAADHPLAAIEGPLGRDVLEREVQLVLTDRTSIADGLSGGIISHRKWRFADLTTRLEFLLAGFGWCRRMPTHMVREHIASGRLKVLDLKEQSGPDLAIHIVYVRGRPPGRAGRWLIDHLRKELQDCVGCGEEMVDSV
ncbi:MAG: LysR family transcriptional regulator [Bauldia litoralis]